MMRSSQLGPIAGVAAYEMHGREAQRQREWRAGGTCRGGLCAVKLLSGVLAVPWSSAWSPMLLLRCQRAATRRGERERARSYRRLEHVLLLGRGPRAKTVCVNKRPGRQTTQVILRRLPSMELQRSQRRWTRPWPFRRVHR